MCHVLCASESGYYHHNAHGYAQKRIHDQALLSHIRATHAEVKGEYGWPRIWRALITKGVRASKERVRKLMQLNGIYARGKRKFVVTTDSKHHLPIAPNARIRQFQLCCPQSSLDRRHHLYRNRGRLVLSSYGARFTQPPSGRL